MEQVSEHEQYITVLCQKVKSVLIKRLSQVAEEIGVEMSCSVYQDVLINAKYCKELLIHYKVHLIIICLLSRNDQRQLLSFQERSVISDQIQKYLCDFYESNHPLILHGKAGSGKSALMAAVFKTMTTNHLRLIGKKNCVFVTRFVGVTPSCRNIKRMLSSICEQVCHYFKIMDSQLK